MPAGRCQERLANLWRRGLFLIPTQANAKSSIPAQGNEGKSTPVESRRERLLPDTERQANKCLVLVVLSASAAFLFLQGFILPDVPRIADGDQGIHLSLATRMYEGQLIYRDFDHFPLPGTELLYLASFKIFGVRAWIAPAMLVGLGVTISWLSIEISRRLMSGIAVILPGLLFLTVPFTSFFDATHHWYSTLAGTAALLVVLEKRTVGHVAWAGALWGAASCFAQSAIVGALGLAFFLMWERRQNKEPYNSLFKKEACLAGSLLGTMVVFNAYIVERVGLRQFWNDTVVFLIKYYPADWFNQWTIYMATPPSIHVWIKWPDVAAFCLVHLIVPLVYILFFVRYKRERRAHPDQPWDRLMLVNLTGLCLFLGIAHAAGYMRMYTVALPALILLVWFLSFPFRVEQILLRLLWIVALLLAIARPAIIQTRWHAVLDLPTGRTSFAGSRLLYDKIKWVSARTSRGDYFFDDPQICFALRLRDPSRVPFLRPTDYTRPEQVQDSLRALEAHQVRFVGWYASLENEIVDPSGDHLGPLRLYLRAHYHRAKVFENGDEIWERNK